MRSRRLLLALTLALANPVSASDFDRTWDQRTTNDWGAFVARLDPLTTSLLIASELEPRSARPSAVFGAISSPARDGFHLEFALEIARGYLDEAYYDSAMADRITGAVAIEYAKDRSAEAAWRAVDSIIDPLQRDLALMTVAAYLSDSGAIDDALKTTAKIKDTDLQERAAASAAIALLEAGRIEDALYLAEGFPRAPTRAAVYIHAARFMASAGDEDGTSRLLDRAINDVIGLDTGYRRSTLLFDLAACDSILSPNDLARLESGIGTIKERSYRAFGLAKLAKVYHNRGAKSDARRLLRIAGDALTLSEPGESDELTILPGDISFIATQMIELDAIEEGIEFANRDKEAEWQSVIDALASKNEFQAAKVLAKRAKSPLVRGKLLLQLAELAAKNDRKSTAHDLMLTAREEFVNQEDSRAIPFYLAELASKASLIGDPIAAMFRSDAIDQVNAAQFDNFSVSALKRLMNDTEITETEFDRIFDLASTLSNDDPSRYEIYSLWTAVVGASSLSAERLPVLREKVLAPRAANGDFSLHGILAENFIDQGESAAALAIILEISTAADETQDNCLRTSLYKDVARLYLKSSDTWMAESYAEISARWTIWCDKSIYLLDSDYCDIAQIYSDAENFPRALEALTYVINPSSLPSELTQLVRKFGVKPLTSREEELLDRIARRRFAPNWK